MAGTGVRSSSAGDQLPGTITTRGPPRNRLGAGAGWPPGREQATDDGPRGGRWLGR